MEYTLTPGKLPTEEERATARAKADVDHIETTYGNFWKVFKHKNGKHYLEFDSGHFSSKFAVAEITEQQYISLKEDFSLYKEFVSKIDRTQLKEKVY